MSYNDSYNISEAAYNSIVQSKIRANARKTFYKTYPDVYERFERNGYDEHGNFHNELYKEPSDFDRKMMESISKYGKLTKKQVEALRKSWRKRETNKLKWKNAEKDRVKNLKDVEVQEGRQTIKGKIHHVKTVTNMYGLTYKMIVEREDGWRFYGSIPNKLWDEYYDLNDINENEMIDYKKFKGLEIEFDAEVQLGKEKGFSFLKRPTKVKII